MQPNWLRLLSLSALVMMFAFGGVVAAQDDTDTEDDAPIEVQYLVPEVLSELPHDTDAFTQGLLLYEGNFFESTGLYGRSSLREVDPETGEVIRGVRLPEQIFAEGLALVDDRLIQLTWRAQTAVVYDLESFEPLELWDYAGEGWGLCYDGDVLYRTDGSSNLFVHDTETFRQLDTIPVTLEGEPVEMLNELECVDDVIYSNVWMTENIMVIDKETGEITTVIDASGLLTREEIENLGNGGVLNGIAYDEENDVFFITGKLWPKIFEVEFVPADEE